MVQRYKPPFKVNIGRQRIPYTDDSSQANFERAVRGQIKDVIGNFSAWVRHMETVSADVLVEAMQPIFDLSQVYVPRDTQALANSGYLEKRRVGSRSVAELGYAKGGHPHYAAFVHENLDFYHAPPTQAKFLERAIMEEEFKTQKRILDGMKEASSV